MIVYVTEHWEERGIEECTATPIPNTQDYVNIFRPATKEHSAWTYCYELGVNAFKTRAEAAVVVEARCAAKIVKLEKQLAKLRQMEF